MSLMTTAHLLDRYGPLLTEEQLGQVLHMEPGTIRNQRATHLPPRSDPPARRQG